MDGFSPDGLKLLEGQCFKLIEIKCPILGATNGVEDIIKDLPYIKCDKTRAFPYLLNKNHAYYGQVQLGLALLNIQLCDFVIYSSFDNDIVVIEVEKDEPFIISLLNKLHFVYFNYFIKQCMQLNIGTQ